LKLGTLKDETRDGRLIVVSQDLRRATFAQPPVTTLQAALDRWVQAAPGLRAQYAELNAGTAANAFALDLRTLRAPLPRAPQWLDAAAFHSHADLMEKVFGHDPPPDKLQIPLMYPGASDDFLGPYDDMPLPSEADGMDFEAEVGVVVDRVPKAVATARAGDHIKLLTLINDASLRTVAGREIRTGCDFPQAKPATSFAPVVVTPEELRGSWQDYRVHLQVRVSWNGRWFGHPNAGHMGFGFDQLVAHAARTRNLSAGTIIGSGTISNSDCRVVGSACIAELRGMETLDKGRAATGYMRFGDSVRIEMLDADGHSVFGAIEQRLVQAS
jgi:fumarylacetoacetate (FAA) hydrolase